MISIWAQGFRHDAGLNCKPGNKACGKRCIPNDQKCRSGSGAFKRALGVGATVAGASALAFGVSAIANGLDRKSRLEGIRSRRRATQVVRQSVRSGGGQLARRS